MSNPITFVNTYAIKAQQLMALLQDLRGMNDMIDQDSTLLDRYFAQPATAVGGPRSDIVKADITGAHDAINQVIFAYDTGNPVPQKSLIYKVLP